MMESPYSFADLPKPLDKHCRQYAAPVYSLRGNLKRKRREIVVGIDQASVMIFNVQSQTLSCSYAVPPQTRFACTPASFWTPATELQPAQRDTFIVLKEDNRRGDRPKLLRITERAGKDIEFTQPVTTSFLLPRGNVIGLETLSDGNSSPQAIAIYQNGAVVTVAEDLSRQFSQVSVCTTQEQEGSKIEYASLVEVSSARKGLLKGRADILASLGTTHLQSHSVAVFVIRRNDETIVRLCAVGSALERNSIYKLDDIYIPAHDISTSSQSEWQLRASSGQLAQLLNGKLHLFDLSKTVPRPKLVIDQESEVITAFTSTSNSSIMTLTADRATIYDATYGSILATKSLDRSRPMDQSSKKRKRDHQDHSTSRSPILVGFTSINKVVIVAESLVAIEIDQSISALNSKNVRTVALADITGRGTFKINDLQQDEWRAQLQPAIESRDVARLEDICITGLSLEHVRNEDHATSSDDDSSPTSQIWTLNQASYDLTPEQKSRAMMLLGTLFSSSAADGSELHSTSKLKLRIVSHNLLRWLVVAEILTISNLSAVLETAITARDIAETLGQADSSFELLLDILVLPAHLSLDFVIECARLLIRSMDTTLPAGLQNGDQIDGELELESAEHELSTALATLSSGLEIRSVIMEQILGRLYTFPQQMLSKHLRAGLEQKDLLFLINILRIELANAGWTERYIDTAEAPAANPESTALIEASEPTESTALIEANGVHENMAAELPTPSNRAIKTIGNLFNAVIDAIGLAGWLVGLGEEDDDSYNMITIFQAEISAALASVYEAHALDACLRDFEKYVESVRLSSEIYRTPKKEDFVTVVGETTSEIETSAMPLGGRSGIIADIQPTSNVRKTKQGKFNKLKSRQKFVGLYQFEQIRV